MTPAPRYAVIAEPAVAAVDFEWIETLRRRHDPVGQARVGPHLTLFFAASFADPAPLVRAVERAAARFPAFDLQLGPLALLPDATGGAIAALAATTGRAECIALHDMLYAGELAQHLRTDLPFEPHLTLGRCAEIAEAQTIADRIASERRRIETRVTGLTLVELGEHAAIPRLLVPFRKAP